MTCCRAEDFKWCEDFQTVFMDEEGKEYCVYHAPKGHKGIKVEDFNSVIFNIITEARERGRVCNLTGTVFESIQFTRFREENPFPGTDFRDAIFSGETDFAGVTFSREIDFHNVDFQGKVNFSGATFSREVSFIQATFRERVYFINVTFNRFGYFNNTTFSEEAVFRRATFNREAGFYKTAFKREADFINITLNGEAFFNDSIFMRRTNFDGGTFSGSFSIYDTTFKEGAYFIDATFGGRTYFLKATFEHLADFGKAIFSGPTHFIKAGFADANFSQCAGVGPLRFEEIDLSHVSFLEADLRIAQFVNCKWPRKGGSLSPEVLYDEIKASEKGGEAFEPVENLYRRLKQKSKEEHNEPEASKWHYREKEMFRKKYWWRRFNPVSFSNLYWTSSGYGERPVRAGILIFFLLAMFTLLMNYLGLESVSGKPVEGVMKIQGFSENISLVKLKLLLATILQYALFAKDIYFKPSTVNGSLVLTVLTKFLLLQAALFALALRNKFRR